MTSKDKEQEFIGPITQSFSITNVIIIPKETISNAILQNIEMLTG